MSPNGLPRISGRRFGTGLPEWRAGLFPLLSCDRPCIRLPGHKPGWAGFHIHRSATGRVAVPRYLTWLGLLPALGNAFNFDALAFYLPTTYP